MNTLLLQSYDRSQIDQAAKLLRDGKLVAIPTETVYGLAANALDAQAVDGIFDAKGRPQDNPLIVHIHDLSQLDQLCASVPDTVAPLAQAFWPGPLTMVLPKSDAVPAVVSAGLDTVGVRMPAHQAARDILQAAGIPLAAPSANTSGRPSPTCAEHVREDMDGKISAIVDGGECEVGVESTVLDLTGPTPRILRPGAVTEEQIAAVLGSAETDAAVNQALDEGERPKSPGMKYRHYAPKAPIILFEGAPEDTARMMRRELREGDGVLCFEEYLDLFNIRPFVMQYGKSFDYARQSHQLFSLLRQFDQASGVHRILAQGPRPFGKGSATANRLRRAASFQVVQASPAKIIGATGRSGSGKSYFIASFTQPGVAFLDADEIYGELLAECKPMIRELALRFPRAMTGRGIDRRILASIVFAQEAPLRDLNRITHKYVVEEMKRRIAAYIISGKTCIVMDVPLLFESAMDRLCTMTVGIVTSDELSLARIMARDEMSEGAARARLAAQPDNSFYYDRCDVVIENTGDRQEYDKKIENFFQKYVQ